MARNGSKKRKSQPAGPGKSRYLSKSSKKQKKSNDLYEASDSDPDEEKHAERYDVSSAPAMATVGSVSETSAPDFGSLMLAES